MYEMADHLGLLPKDEAAGALYAHPKFHPHEHHLLCSELKQL